MFIYYDDPQLKDQDLAAWQNYCKQIRGLIRTASKRGKPALLLALADLLAKVEGRRGPLIPPDGLL